MSQLNRISLQQIMACLRAFRDPESGKDWMALGRIKDLRMDDAEGKVSFKLQITAGVQSQADSIRDAITTALKKIDGIRQVQIECEMMGASAASGASHAPRAAAPNGNQKIPGVKSIVAVSSGKGGVGKSTVSVNLATSLALEGFKVGLIDADIHGPNIPTMMGVMELPTILKDPVKGEIFIPPVAHGVKVMSMGFLVPNDQPLIWRGPMLHQALQQFLHQVEWGELDFLVVDMPPGTGDIQLSLAQLVPLSGAVLVTTPQEVAMQDVRRAFTMWEKVKVPIYGVVENMSFFRAPDTGKTYSIFGSGGGAILADKFRCPLLKQLPIVPQVCEGGDTGRPIVVRDPKSEVAVLLRELAQRVALLVAESGVEKGSAPELVVGKF